MKYRGATAHAEQAISAIHRVLRTRQRGTRRMRVLSPQSAKLGTADLTPGRTILPPPISGVAPAHGALALSPSRRAEGEENMAETKQIGTLSGYGYMRSKRDVVDTIPPTWIRGYYYGANNCVDPVLVGGYVVEQSDLSRIRQESGDLPHYMYTDDWSGSYRYLHHIQWSEEEARAAGVLHKVIEPGKEWDLRLSA